PYKSQNFTSIRQYFRRIDSLNSHLISSTDALTKASNEASLYAQPGQRFDSMTITPLTHDGLWQQAFGRTFSERITINRRPPGGGSLLSQDCWIEHADWNIPMAGDPWTLTWQLSPAS
ncbi:MAG: hypothetical protein ACREP9_15140, partial [Candidatus Dormibacteraceae bacterium]